MVVLSPEVESGKAPTSKGAPHQLFAPRRVPTKQPGLLDRSPQLHAVQVDPALHVPSSSRPRPQASHGGLTRSRRSEPLCLASSPSPLAGKGSGDEVVLEVGG